MIILDTTKNVVLNLTGLEIFFIVTTLISLVINIIQFMVSKKTEQALVAPLSNSLIGLFNDIKTKNTTIFTNQQLMLNPNNPHKEIETLKWEYYQFSQNVFSYMLGFQEALVGALVTLNPTDKDGKRSFKASDYGLTPEEKEQRNKYAKQWMEQQKIEKP